MIDAVAGAVRRRAGARHGAPARVQVADQPRAGPGRAGPHAQHPGRPAGQPRHLADGRRAARLGAAIDEARRPVAGRPRRRCVGPASVDVGNAGTVMRFLPPVAALADGDVRVRRRPAVARSGRSAPVVAGAARPRRRRHRRPRPAAADGARPRLAARRQRSPSTRRCRRSSSARCCSPAPRFADARRGAARRRPAAVRRPHRHDRRDAARRRSTRRARRRRITWRVEPGPLDVGGCRRAGPVQRRAVPRRRRGDRRPGDGARLAAPHHPGRRRAAPPAAAVRRRGRPRRATG